MKTLLCLAFFGWLLFGLSPAMAQESAKDTREQKLITHHAPVVFLGRPVEGREYTDSEGQVYFSTLIEVLEVLRGQKLLHTGFVELMDSISPSNSAALVPDIIDLPGLNAMGVYFCSPNNKPRYGAAYKTTENPPLQPYRSLRAANITFRSGPHGDFVGGLNRGFADEQAVKDYLATVPNLAPIPKPIYTYPKKYFDESALRKTPPPAPKPVPRPVPEEVIPPSPSMALPMEALPDFTRIMHLIRSNQSLTGADSAYIKKYIPSLMPKKEPRKPQVPPAKLPRSSGAISPGVNGPGFSAMSFAGDTALSMSIVNLHLAESIACSSPAFEGEVWLATNQAGLYMDQIYFEMSTSADLKTTQGPFGETIDFSYTSLTGTSGYVFYHFWESTTKKITVVGYPDQNNLHVQLYATAQPFFRFRYSLPDVIPAPTSPKINFTPLATATSLRQVGYFLISNPTGLAAYYPKRFITLEPSVPAVIRRPGIHHISSHGSSITAGTGTTLQISGFGFGATRVCTQYPSKKSEVQFSNADDGGQSFLAGLDSIDYLASNNPVWTDTLISITVPSFITRQVGGKDKQYVIGSGPLRIVGSSGVVLQGNEPVSIRYNLDQLTVSNKREKIYLASSACTGGQVFYLDSAVVSYFPQAKAIIKAALRTWSDSLGIRLTLSNTLVVGLNAPALDKKNVIFFSPSLSGTSTVMETLPYNQQRPLSKTVTNATSTMRVARSGADIGIDKMRAWSFDSTSTAPLSGVDFYATMLHELGHFLGLEHVVEIPEIMYYSTGGPRRSLASGSRTGVAGGQLEVKRAYTITDWGPNSTTATPIAVLGKPLSTCNTQGSGRQNISNPERGASQEIGTPAIYPNPFSGESELLLPANIQGQVDCIILDASGRTLSRSWVDSAGPIKLGKELPAGLYLVRLLTFNKNFTVRMVKTQ